MATSDHQTPRPVHELVHERALQRPGAPAATRAGDELTHGELDAAAGRLAAELRRRGVRRETPVALHMERSLELLAAYLAVWRAGGTAILMDPAWPEPRRREVLAALPPLVTMVAGGRETAALPGPVLAVDRRAWTGGDPGSGDGTPTDNPAAGGMPSQSLGGSPGGFF